MMTLQEKLQGFGRSSVTAELLQGSSHAEAFTTIRVPARPLRTGHLSRHSPLLRNVYGGLAPHLVRGVS